MLSQMDIQMINRLKEENDFGEGVRILNYFGLDQNPTVRECLKTAMQLKNVGDPQQKNHAYSFMESVIKEIENTNLRNHNLGSATDGSYQSTKNQQNFPQVGRSTKDGQNSMMGMANTTNQWRVPKSLLDAIQRDVITPRDNRIKNKNRELSSLHKQNDNLLREIESLREIKNHLTPDFIDLSGALSYSLTRETEKHPLKNSLGILKPQFDQSAFSVNKNKDMTTMEMLQLDKDLNEKRGVKTLPSYSEASTISTD